MSKKFKTEFEIDFNPEYCKLRYPAELCQYPLVNSF